MRRMRALSYLFPAGLPPWVVLNAFPPGARIWRTPAWLKLLNAARFPVPLVISRLALLPLNVLFLIRLVKLLVALSPLVAFSNVLNAMRELFTSMRRSAFAPPAKVLFSMVMLETGSTIIPAARFSTVEMLVMVRFVELMMAMPICESSTLLLANVVRLVRFTEMPMVKFETVQLFTVTLGRFAMPMPMEVAFPVMENPAQSMVVFVVFSTSPAKAQERSDVSAVIRRSIFPHAPTLNPLWMTSFEMVSPMSVEFMTVTLVRLLLVTVELNIVTL